MGQVRQSRFDQIPTTGIRVTDRDRDILQAVGEHRLLSTEHLQELLGAGRHPDVIRRRLTKLFRHGYLNRPNEQRARHTLGGAPLVYGLTYRGAQEIVRDRGIQYPYERRTGIFLEHRLFIADVLIAAQRACTSRGFRLIPFREILANSPASTRELKNSTGWHVAFSFRTERYRLGIFPDAIFAIDFADGLPPALFFLEADRGTMNVTLGSQGLDRPSIFKKQLLYYRSWRQWKAGSTTPPYGFKNPRVLMVVDTPRDPTTRVANMIDLVPTVDAQVPAGLFLFTTRAALLAADFLAHEWQNARGDARPIYSASKVL